MNRFNTQDAHRFGTPFYDSDRQINIKRLVAQNIEHNPIIKTHECSQLLFNPFTQYEAHCRMFCKNECKNECKEECKEECPCEDDEEEHHIHIEHIYNNEVFHNFNICEEREKMKRDLLKSRETKKISIKDFLKK